MKIYPLVLATALSSLGLVDSAVAGGQCGNRAAVVDTLAKKFGETRRGIGLAANNGIIEIFSSGQTGSWTITITMANGMTCLVASGQNYETIAEELPAKGDPA